MKTPTRIRVNEVCSAPRPGPLSCASIGDNMNRSVRIPLLSLGAALVLAVIGACGSDLSQFGEACSVYAVESSCESPNLCECRVGAPYCVCTHRCEQDRDCPSGNFCLPGQNPATNQQDLFCFKADAGLPR